MISRSSVAVVLSCICIVNGLLTKRQVIEESPLMAPYENEEVEVDVFESVPGEKSNNLLDYAVGRVDEDTKETTIIEVIDSTFASTTSRPVTTDATIKYNRTTLNSTENETTVTTSAPAMSTKGIWIMIVFLIVILLVAICCAVDILCCGGAKPPPPPPASPPPQSEPMGPSSASSSPTIATSPPRTVEIKSSKEEIITPKKSKSKERNESPVKQSSKEKVSKSPTKEEASSAGSKSSSSSSGSVTSPTESSPK